MPKFMLILHAKPGAYQELSPEETQRVFEKYRAWTDKLRAESRLVGTDKLKNEGGQSHVVAAEQAERCRRPL